MKVLAIIPARGGSKEIPMKNIKKLGGKPLIEYTIQAAKKSKEINRIIVSTDSTRIAQISLKAGAEIPFLRPKALSKDNSSIIDTINHTLEFLRINESYVPDIISLLQPTSPLRTSQTIDQSIRMLKKSKFTSVIAVSEIKTHPYASFWNNNNYLVAYNSNFRKYDQRQKYPALYYPTGSVYTFWNTTLKKYNSIYGPKIKPLIEQFSIDIDTKYDFFIAEMMILHWKKYRKKFQR